MKKSIVIIILCWLALSVFGQEKKIVGRVGNLQADKIYLYEVVDQYLERYRMIDSAKVEKGKFIFQLKNSRAELYFLGDTPWHGGFFFADGNKITLEPVIVNENRIVWSVQGSPMGKIYQDFEKRLHRETYMAIRDSLNALFYKAREADNDEEMARIKEESMPYYEKGNAKEQELVSEYVQKNKENPFGLYLYYSQIFQRKDFPTVDLIASERKYVDSFGAKARNTSYFSRIAERLTQFENCAIGHEAPEIVGKDSLGKVVRLSDFRGNYVIVDFWNSYCHWCREETPALQKALERFKGKNFKILGVSSDTKHKDWMDAIHKDGSYWDHLILEKGNRVMSEYCVKGIPYIILVGPDGKILAKGLRGKELVSVPEKFIK